MAPPLVELMYHAGQHGIAGPVRGMDFRDVMSWNYTNRLSGFQIEPVIPFGDPFIVKIEPPFRPRVDFRPNAFEVENNLGLSRKRKKDPFGLD